MKTSYGNTVSRQITGDKIIRNYTFRDDIHYTISCMSIRSVF